MEWHTLTHMTILTTSAADAMNQKIGRRVRNLMFGKMTQSELADRIGTDQSGMSRRIHGKTEFSPFELKVTAESLGVSVDALFADTHPSDYKAAVSDLAKEREKRRPAPSKRPSGRRDSTGPGKRAA